MSIVSPISGSKNVLPFIPRGAVGAPLPAAETLERRRRTSVSTPSALMTLRGTMNAPLCRSLIYRGLPAESAAAGNDNAPANVIDEFALRAGFLPVNTAGSDAFFFDSDVRRAARCPPPPPEPVRILPRTDVLTSRGEAA